MCFDQACRDAADRVLVAAIAFPIAAAALAIAIILRRPPPSELEDRGIFEDPDTGTLLEPVGAGITPERDSNGQLVVRAYSYTPLPVEQGAKGERIKVDVGPIKARKPRTYVFDKVLRGGSRLLLVTLPRPLGVVFEYDEPRRRVSVTGLIAGGNAEKKRKVAGLDRQLMESVAVPGDVLRAVTATNFVYGTRALFGAVPPERHIVLYGVTPKATWAKVRAALRKGEPNDGPVTLVLERSGAQPSLDVDE